MMVLRHLVSEVMNKSSWFRNPEELSHLQSTLQQNFIVFGS